MIIRAFLVLIQLGSIADAADEGSTVHYKCEANLIFSATYTADGSTALVKIWDGTQYQLKRAPKEEVAPAAFFENGNVIFVETPKWASLTMGDVLHRNCRRIRH